jgi:hypothetical protein
LETAGSARCERAAAVPLLIIVQTWLLETLGEKEHLDWQAHDAGDNHTTNKPTGFVDRCVCSGTPSLMGHLEIQWQWRGAEWNVQLCNPAGGSSIGGSGGFVPSARFAQCQSMPIAMPNTQKHQFSPNTKTWRE